MYMWKKMYFCDLLPQSLSLVEFVQDLEPGPQSHLKGMGTCISEVLGFVFKRLERQN